MKLYFFFSQAELFEQTRLQRDCWRTKVYEVVLRLTFPREVGGWGSVQTAVFLKALTALINNAIITDSKSQDIWGAIKQSDWMTVCSDRTILLLSALWISLRWLGVQVHILHTHTHTHTCLRVDMFIHSLLCAFKSISQAVCLCNRWEAVSP